MFLAHLLRKECTISDCHEIFLFEETRNSKSFPPPGLQHSHPADVFSQTGWESEYRAGWTRNRQLPFPVLFVVSKHHMFGASKAEYFEISFSVFTCFRTKTSGSFFV